MAPSTSGCVREEWFRVGVRVQGSGSGSEFRGQTDGRTDGQTDDRQTDRLIEKETNVLTCIQHSINIVNIYIT